MKTQTLEKSIVSTYREQLGHIGRVTACIYNLGDGFIETYAQVQISAHITAVLHHDIDEIVLRAGGDDIFTVAWNDEVIELLWRFDTLQPYEALTLLAPYGVPQ